MDNITPTQAPSKAFNLASITVLATGVITYCIGLFNASMQLNEKGYYLVILLYGLFSAVSLQKSIRDKQEHLKTSNIYHALSLISTGSAILLLLIGLYNADLLLSEKGFYGLAYLMSLYSAVAVQKNIRDLAAHSHSQLTEEPLACAQQETD
ncbi:inner membrane protein YiaA [Pseudoalteromonas umbrosa]|uniref:inner membrane protein YiaA n=1 Tax=Pseudoalteromonas umbrosa TaxID=3048489 RepID=UPI0024C3F829|nr:inner membrane protein YiaA [Pseudoalteromonas sp. B95]MDK1288460.1 inner membrane protein YiaA [Pseudoalteromonas sp. B95]